MGFFLRALAAAQKSWTPSLYIPCGPDAREQKNPGAKDVNFECKICHGERLVKLF
jgi:hypothetical protein